MKRIAIIGNCGAGKSFVAAALSQKLDIPVTHLDQHYWKPGWVATSDAEWEVIQTELIKPERWIMDGNFRKTFRLRLDAADAIVFLDRSRWLCLWRILRRHKCVRADLPEGCEDQLRVEYFTEFLWHVWMYPKRRPEILAMLERYRQSKSVHILQSDNEVQAFLASAR